MKNNHIILVSDDWSDLESLWLYHYDHKQYKIVKAIKYKWNWRKFRYCYQLEIRELTPEEKESDYYKVYEGNMLKALSSVIGKGIEIYNTIRDRKNQKGE